MSDRDTYIFAALMLGVIIMVSAFTAALVVSRNYNLQLPPYEAQ